MPSAVEGMQMTMDRKSRINTKERTHNMEHTPLTYHSKPSSSLKIDPTTAQRCQEIDLLPQRRQACKDVSTSLWRKTSWKCNRSNNHAVKPQNGPQKSVKAQKINLIWGENWNWGKKLVKPLKINKLNKYFWIWWENWNWFLIRGKLKFRKKFVKMLKINKWENSNNHVVKPKMAKLELLSFVIETKLVKYSHQNVV